MNPLKEAQIKAQDFPPYVEAYQNSGDFGEYIGYLADEMGRPLDEDENEEAQEAYNELTHKYQSHV